MSTRTLARGLGFFSIGLGLAELLGTGPLSRYLGMEDHKGLLRLFGLREIAAGIGLLSQDRLAPWMWARVAGDALDLTLLGTTFANRPNRRTNVGIATGAVAGVTALDILAGERLRSGDWVSRGMSAAASA